MPSAEEAPHILFSQGIHESHERGCGITPRCGHRKTEPSAFAQQTLIGSRIGLAHFLRCVGDLELDRPTAKRLEVYEQQTFLCPGQVAWMRLTMQ